MSKEAEQAILNIVDGLHSQLEAKDKVIEGQALYCNQKRGHVEILEKQLHESIPRGKIEAVRNNYMQFLSDCGNDDSDRESAQIVFDILEELLKGQT